jgi:CubicO group peptidase (beta-lactamase class C family)
MKDTAFSVAEATLGRLATCYQFGTGRLAVYDEARGGRWSRPPAFHSGGGGLVSTADDYLAFARMMLSRGRYGKERMLTRPTVELMISDQQTAEERPRPLPPDSGTVTAGASACP